MTDNIKSIQPVFCSFCSKTRTEVKKLIVANEAGICNECIDLCSTILQKEKVEKIKVDQKNNHALNPVKIKKYLDQYIIGQTSAKIALSVGIVNHFKRIHFDETQEIEKSNIILFGPSGSGKTLLAKKIASYLDIPFVIADATTLTETGYVGEDVESLVSRLLAAADYNVDMCQQGIIFIDEIDKISKRNDSSSVRDVSGEGVQQALLKLIEGTTCKVEVSGSRKNAAQNTVEIDTTNILFIAAGAFADMDNIIKKRQSGTNSIGFSSVKTITNVDREDTLPDDFLKYGMIPEFIGRFPVIVHTNDLDLDALIKILTEPKNNLIHQMQFYFSIDELELVFSDEAINIIAEQALAANTGARALKRELESILRPYLFDSITLKSKGHTRIEITADTVRGGSPKFS